MPPTDTPPAPPRRELDRPAAESREGESAAVADDRKGNLLARFVTLNVLGVAVTSVIGFGTSIVLARWLGPADRGLLGLMLSVSWVAVVLTGVGIPWAAVYYSSRRDAAPNTILGNNLLHAATLVVVLVPAAWLLHGSLASAFGEGRGGLTWVLAAAIVPLMFLDWATGGQMQGMLLFGRYNVSSVMSKSVYALGVIVLVGALHVGVAGAVIATGAGSVVMVLRALGPLLASGWPHVDRRLLGAMLRYGSRVQIGSIFQVANARLDVIILQFFRPLSQVGYYVVAQAIAELVILLSSAFQASVMPLVSQYEGDARQATTSADSLRHHGILAAVAMLANVGFGSILILFVYGAKFHQALVPMLVLLPGVWFLGMGGVIQGDLSGRGRPELSSRLAGFAAAVTLVADLLLIPPFGVMGAALASVIAYTTYGVTSLLVLHRVSGIAVRRLLVPTRGDFASYWLAARRLAARARRSARGQA